MLRAATLLLTCALLALTTAACGKSGAGDGGDPASLVPAGAPVYVEATVRPEGGQRDDALAAAGKLLGTRDPAARLRQLVDEAGAEKGISWERDFAPWLGEKAGLWASGLERDAPSYAAVIASTDEDAATAALARFAKAEGGTGSKRSYKGIDYAVDDEGLARGLVDDFVVLGTEGAFKRTVDTRDGDKLGDSDRYEEAVDELSGDRLGHYFFDVAPVASAASKKDPAAARQFEQFRGFFAFDEMGPIVGAFTADGEGMALDTVLTKLPDGPLRRLAALWSGGATELLPALPGDVWGAFATPRIGEALQSLVSSFGGAIGGAAITAQVQQATGLNLQEDVFSWMGDLGVFVRGGTEATLDGGLVIQSTDDAKAATAFGKLVGLIGRQSGTAARPVRLAGAESAFLITAPDAEKPIVFARGNGRVVAAYGEQAASDALVGKAKLGDSQDYDRAKALLADGMEPSLLLSLPSVLALVEASGQTDADYTKAKPYLDALGVVTAGGKVDGDRVQSRMAVGFK